MGNLYECAPMGWNSYDYYDTAVTEDDLLRNAGWMKDHLKKHGYEYLVCDIEWYAPKAGTRRSEYQYIPFQDVCIDEYSRLLPDPVRFPSGFDGIASKIHEMGLKFGIHIMRGIPRTAAHSHMKTIDGTDSAEIADPYSISKWNPDMYGVKDCEEGQKYYDSLIELYASWGVDFIKCDDICNTNMYPYNPYSGKHEIEMLHRAIEKCGRPIVLSLSPGPALIEQASHYRANANMWRITDDFWDDFRLVKVMFHRCEEWQGDITPGGYPDCDMLPFGVVGKGFGAERKTNFTPAEIRTVMTLWCIFGSPLMIGSELPLLDDYTISVLTDESLLKYHSIDWVPTEIRLSDSEAIWQVKNASSGETHFAFFNLSEKPRHITYYSLSADLEPHDCTII